MVSRTTFIALVILILMSVTFIGSIKSDDQNLPYKTVLLNFYEQELISHAAILFAAVVALFTFLNSKNYKKKNPSIIIGGILLTLIVYAGFRLLLYGQFCNAIVTDTSNKPFGNLNDYNSYIVNNLTFNNVNPDPLSFEINLLSHFRSNWDILLSPITGVVIAGSMGFFSSYALYLPFGEQFKKKDYKIKLYYYFIFTIIILLISMFIPSPKMNFSDKIVVLNLLLFSLSIYIIILIIFVKDDFVKL